MQLGNIIDIQAHYPDHICDAREVNIETSNISSTDFNLTDEQKTFLIFSGYVSTVEFLKKYNYIKEIHEENQIDINEMKLFIQEYNEKAEKN